MMDALDRTCGTVNMARRQRTEAMVKVREVGGKRLFQEADMQELHTGCRIMYVNFAGW